MNFRFIKWYPRPIRLHTQTEYYSTRNTRVRSGSGPDGYFYHLYSLFGMTIGSKPQIKQIPKYIWFFFSTTNDQNSELKISVHAGSRQPLKKNDLDVRQPQSSIISNKLLETLKPWMSLSATETCQACISHA